MKEFVFHKKPVLVVLSGPPASGKSTFLEQVKFSPNGIIVSTDQLRKEWLGDESDQSRNPFIWERAMGKLEWYLASSNVVVFDATNVKRSGRKQLIKLAKHWGAAAVCLYFYPELDECKRRNQLRGRHVPEEVIEKMWTRFTRPTELEGWDLVIACEDYQLGQNWRKEK